MAKKETTTKTVAEKAKEIATANGVKTVYVNSKGEFFTNKNYALASEKDKDKVKTFDFANAAEEVSETNKNTSEDE